MSIPVDLIPEKKADVAQQNIFVYSKMTFALGITPFCFVQKITFQFYTVEWMKYFMFEITDKNTKQFDSSRTVKLIYTRLFSSKLIKQRTGELHYSTKRHKLSIYKTHYQVILSTKKLPKVRSKRIEVNLDNLYIINLAYD